MTAGLLPGCRFGGRARLTCPCIACDQHRLLWWAQSAPVALVAETLLLMRTDASLDLRAAVQRLSEAPVAS